MKAYHAKMSSWCKIVPKKNDLGIMKAEATNYQFRKNLKVLV